MIKIGNKVKLIEIKSDTLNWNPEMNKFLNCIGTVKELRNIQGWSWIGVQFTDNDRPSSLIPNNPFYYYYPLNCLKDMTREEKLKRILNE